MRVPLFALPLLLTLAFPAAAQQQAPKLDPLPEPPEILDEGADLLSPDITLIERGDETVEEYRIRGKLYMIKVMPSVGAPYYLLDKHGDGIMVREDSGQKISVPMWILRSW